MNESPRRRRLAVPTMALVLVVGACSSDDGTTSDTDAATTIATPDDGAVTTTEPSDTSETTNATEASDTTDAPSTSDGASTTEATDTPDAQVIPDGVNMTGTGPSPAGLFSQAALDQDSCNPDGQTDFFSVGGGPYCVDPWDEGADNGGATSPGVTATEVHVIAYIPNAAMMAAGTGSSAPKNQATGEVATPADALADQLEIYEYAKDNLQTYQHWGRDIVVEIVEASGTDEAAQRADALTVIDKKPFMVVDLTGTATSGAAVFAAAVAAQQIVTVSSSTTGTIAAEQAPYRWSYSADQDATGILTAAFVGKTLAGNPARYAGDEALTTQTRSFGVAFPSAAFDFDTFEAAVESNGGPPMTEALEFDSTNPALITEQAPTMVNRFKSSGVTSVVLLGDNTVVAALMAAATAADYHPEWIITGFAYHDFAVFGRGNDQEQMRHAFGISSLFPYLEPGPDYQSLDVFRWYWGTEQGNTWGISNGFTDFVYRGLHYAGANLTPETLEQGWFSVPATGGAAQDQPTFQTGFGDTVGMPYPEYNSLGTDVSMAWYAPDVEGPSQAVGLVGKGQFMYLDGSQRYTFATMPDEEPTFFDESNSVSVLPIESLFPEGVEPIPTACDDCPSSGG